jgi:hypothetical protein
MGLIINPFVSFPVSGFDKSGIKFYFHFEESTGNIINAATTAAGYTNGLGSNADGVKRGNPTYQQTGKIDYAIYYDGTSDHFELGSSLSDFKFLQDGTDLTIAFWLKRGDGTNELQGIFGTGEGGTTIGLAVRLDGTNNNLTVKMENGTGATTQITSSNSWIPDNTTTYYHYIITFEGSSQTWNIYRDNANNENTTDTLTLSTNNPTNLPQVGSEPDTGGVENLVGLIDELVVLTRIITADERAYLYNSGSGQLIT